MAQFSVKTMPNCPARTSMDQMVVVHLPMVARYCTIGETTPVGGVTPRRQSGVKRSGFCKGQSPNAVACRVANIDRLGGPGYPSMYDLVIRNGTVIDGSAPRRIADIVQGGK
jgi:hypothetical protein